MKFYIYQECGSLEGTWFLEEDQKYISSGDEKRPVPFEIWLKLLIEEIQLYLDCDPEYRVDRLVHEAVRNKPIRLNGVVYEVDNPEFKDPSS